MSCSRTQVGPSVCYSAHLNQPNINSLAIQLVILQKYCLKSKEQTLINSTSTLGGSQIYLEEGIGLFLLSCLPPLPNSPLENKSHSPLRGRNCIFSKNHCQGNHNILPNFVYKFLYGEKESYSIILCILTGQCCLFSLFPANQQLFTFQLALFSHHSLTCQQWIKHSSHLTWEIWLAVHDLHYLLFLSVTTKLDHFLWGRG